MEGYSMVRNKKKSWLRKQTSLNALNRYMGTLDLNAISPSYLHNYVRKRKQSGLSEGTINKDLNTVRHLLGYAKDCGVIQSNPIAQFKNLRENQKERPRFTDEQVDAVLDAVKPECSPLFIFMRETGCRREEALSLLLRFFPCNLVPMY